MWRMFFVCADGYRHPWRKQPDALKVDFWSIPHAKAASDGRCDARV